MGRFARIRLIQALAILAFMPALAARAADIAVPAPTYYPAYLPPALYNWTGVYFGGNVGGGILTDSVSQNGTAPFNLAGSGNLRPAGVLGGAQLGANYEFAPWVVGAEVSWTDSGISGSTLIPCSTSCLSATPPILQERATSHALWFATATGRFGYAANDWLFYGKAGGAWMHVSYTQDYLTAVGVTASSQTISADRAGFTAGVGVEYGMTENLSGKIEFDFYDFGTQNYNFVQTPVSVQSNMYALIVGLNYRFNWTAAAPGPVLPPR
ncbi:MAG: outer membrane beta-barrel protein [Xanthobacteraceae bacterium]